MVSSGVYASYDVYDGAIEIRLYPANGVHEAVTHRVLRSVDGGEIVELAVLEEEILWYQDKPIPQGDYEYAVEALDASGLIVATYQCSKKPIPAIRFPRPGLDSPQAEASGISALVTPVRVPAPSRNGGLEYWLHTDLLAFAACADEGCNAYFSGIVDIGEISIRDGSYRVETCLTRPGAVTVESIEEGCDDGDFSLALVDSGERVALVSGLLYVGNSYLFPGLPGVETLQGALDSCGPAGLAVVATVAVSGLRPSKVRFSRGRTAQIWFPTSSLAHLSTDEHRAVIERVIALVKMI